MSLRHRLALVTLWTFALVGIVGGLLVMMAGIVGGSEPLAVGALLAIVAGSFALICEGSVDDYFYRRGE